MIKFYIHLLFIISSLQLSSFGEFFYFKYLSQFYNLYLVLLYFYWDFLFHFILRLFSIMALSVVLITACNTITELSQGYSLACGPHFPGFGSVLFCFVFGLLSVIYRKGIKFYICVFVLVLKSPLLSIKIFFWIIFDDREHSFILPETSRNHWPLRAPQQKSIWIRGEEISRRISQNKMLFFKQVHWGWLKVTYL